MVTQESALLLLGSLNYCATDDFNPQLLHILLSKHLFYPQEVEKRFSEGLPPLDPIEDMGIKEKGLKECIKVGHKFIAFEFYLLPCLEVNLILESQIQLRSDVSLCIL